jgi:kynurenine formamidase
MRRILAIATALGLGATGAHAQTAASPNSGWVPPTSAERCPSKWGPGDVRGSGNHVKPENVLRAVRLIKTGEMIELGHVLSADMPLIGARRFDLVVRNNGKIPTPGQRGAFTEAVFTELGQVGTQWDGFAHQMIGGELYNCVKVDDVITATGFTKLGVENDGTFMSRGVLIDVAKLKGVDMLGDTYLITPEDLQQALARQKLTLQPGDVVLINTGWGRLWGDGGIPRNNNRYNETSPGLSISAEEWLANQDPMIVGSDNCCIEVRPAGVGPLIHPFLLAVKGIHLIENLKLDELAAKNIDEFAFVVQPLKIRGGTGSTVAPTAIH